MHIANNILTQ